MTPDQALHQKVAKKLLSETLRMKKGETLTIETWNSGLPFVRRLVVEAKRHGVVPVVIFEDEVAYVEGIGVAPPDVIGTMGRHEYGLLAGSDAYVFIPGEPVGAYSPSLTRQQIADSTKYNESWYEAAEKSKLRGARLPFGYVGAAYAKQYGKKPEDFIRHQLKATLADLKKISANAKALGHVLKDGAKAKVSVGSSKLEFTLKGDFDIEDGVISEEDVAGGYNMKYVPPGFVTKRVDATSAEGKVAIPAVITRLGLLKDAELEFKGGKLVKWKSVRSSKMLNELVEAVAPEKRTLSMVQVGLNPLMKYEFGRDQSVAGAIALGGFGLPAVVRKGTLSVDGKTLVQSGKLKISG